MMPEQDQPVTRHFTTIRPLLGLALVGYGLLLVLQVVPHESRLVGTISLVLGLVLLLWGVPHLAFRRGRIVAVVGGLCVGGVVGYNFVRGSGLGVPEWGILVYGIALLVAAPRLHSHLGRFEVGSLVAWSFPLVLAPLAIFAMNAWISAGRATTAGDPAVHALVVLPGAMLLEALGTPVDVVGNSYVVTTPRGRLVLGVGLVCAGLYPMVLFGGLVGLHTWQQKVPVKQAAVYLFAGLLALWIVNLLRVAILTKVGIRFGVEALQRTHDHLGWILFALFMVAYWTVVLRRADPTGAP